MSERYQSLEFPAEPMPLSRSNPILRDLADSLLRLDEMPMLVRNAAMQVHAERLGYVGPDTEILNADRERAHYSYRVTSRVPFTRDDWEAIIKRALVSADAVSDVARWEFT